MINNLLLVAFRVIQGHPYWCRQKPKKGLLS